MTVQFRDGYGYGVIQISVGLTYELMPEGSIDDTTTMGELRNQGVFDQTHRRLLLPETYRVLGIYFRFELGFWSILVEAPLEVCPRVEPGRYLPNIAPVYRMLPDGTRQLERLDIQTRNPLERVLRPD